MAVGPIATLGPVGRDSSGYRPLLGERVRGPAVLVIALAIIVIAVFGMRYADQDMPGHLDRSLDALIRHALHQDQPITAALVNLGNPGQATVLVDLILKPLIGRLSYGHLSFPSGHTTVVTAVAFTTAILIAGARWPRSTILRLVAGLAAVAVAVGVAISLVALRVHYATDTVAGYCVALATVLTVALCLDFIGPRFRRPPLQQ